MKRKGPESISNLLKQYLRHESLDTPLNEHRIIYAWGDVMGDVVKKYTKNVFVKNQALHVQLTSAPLRQELMMRRKEIVKQLNEYVGANVIYELVLR